MIKDITRVRLLNGGKMFPELRAKYGVVNTNDPIFIAAINRRVVEFIKKLEGTMPKEKLLEALSKFLQIEKENLLDLRIAEYGEWFKTYLESINFKTLKNDGEFSYQIIPIKNGEK